MQYSHKYTLLPSFVSAKKKIKKKNRMRTPVHYFIFFKTHNYTQVYGRLPANTKHTAAHNTQRILAQQNIVPFLRS